MTDPVLVILGVAFLSSLLAVVLGLLGVAIAELSGGHKYDETFGKYGAYLLIGGALGFICTVAALLIVLIIAIVTV